MTAATATSAQETNWRPRLMTANDRTFSCRMPIFDCTGSIHGDTDADLFERVCGVTTDVAYFIMQKRQNGGDCRSCTSPEVAQTYDSHVINRSVTLWPVQSGQQQR